MRRSTDAAHGHLFKEKILRLTNGNSCAVLTAVTSQWRATAKVTAVAGVNSSKTTAPVLRVSAASEPTL